MTRTGDVGERRVVPTAIGDVAVWTRGQGPTLVLLHGVVANADLWGGFVGEIAATHRCVAVDLPLGAHDLPARAGSRLDPASLADVVAEVLEQVCEEPPVVVANDTGGAIAQYLAIRHPASFSALVLTSCDTFRNFLPWSLRYLQLLARVPGGVWLMVQALRVPAVRRLPIAFGWLARHRVAPGIWRSFLTPSRRSRAVRRDLGIVLRSISGRALDRASADLARLERPVLLVWADTRRTFPIAQGRRLEALLPDARLVPVPDCAAFVPLDQPEVLADLVRDFAKTVTHHQENS